ncbi:glycosyltransferase [Virgibacillus ndiopensis]|uniref:glycosyltransferase n=1 Tax=Virgibacillus ndiopensis TaxID=2004408 RepID=UPI00159B8813|nr:glycosyltransferase [Virgibacillus ndiopensis]
MNFLKNNCDFYFIAESIPLRFGGLTTAMFRRAHVFSEHFDRVINILTFKYEPNLEDIKEFLKQEGFTNDKVIVTNMYDYLSKNDNGKPIQINENEQNHSGHDVLQEFKEIKVIKNENSENVKKIEYLQDGSVEQIKEFDNSGRIRRVRNFQEGDLKEEIYFREDRSKYMVKSFENKEPNVIILLDHAGNVLKKFNSHKELQMYWLELLITDEKTNYMINDSRAMDEMVIDFIGKPVKKIFVIHSIHLRKPYNTFSTVRTGNRYLFKNIGQADGIVFLTNGQLNDVASRYGNRSTFSVIPHYIEDNKSTFAERKLANRFIVVSRYHEEKQLGHIIKAFNILHKEGLDFQLDFYGKGKEKESLNSLIREFSLEEKIKLHDFIDNPEIEFSRSMGSFLTSKYEGFGLTILESLKNNCPVFAYDIKYGPSDMIRSGYNGFLIESNNIEALAATIKKFIHYSSAEKRKMFSNAGNSIVDFSEDQFINKWEQTLENATYYSNYRYKLADKEYIQNTVEEIYFNKQYLTVSISSNVIEPSYKSIKQDLKGITIEINNKQWEMQRVNKKLNKSKLFYTISIPLDDLQEVIDIGRFFSITYYLNLDDVKYRGKLKYHLNDRKRPQSYKFHVYQISNNDQGLLEIRKEKVSGARGFFRYLKYNL